jgi:hypothetical protein
MACNHPYNWAWSLESRVLSHLAERVAKRVTNRAVRRLQSLKEGHTLAGDDSPLANVWDEFCDQVQGDKSLYWDMYLDGARAIILSELAREEELDRITIWLQTRCGEEWLSDAEPSSDGFVRVKDIPWEDESNADLVLEQLLILALRWSNVRIRRAQNPGGGV